MRRTRNFLTLKWGTWKEWNFDNSEKGQALMKESFEIHDATGDWRTPRQKEILCELIDLCDGHMIYLDYFDEYIFKNQAKKYVMSGWLPDRLKKTLKDDEIFFTFESKSN